MGLYFCHIGCNRLWHHLPDESCSVATNPTAMLNLRTFSHTARNWIICIHEKTHAHTHTYKHPSNTAKDSILHPLLIETGGSSREKTSWGKQTVSKTKQNEKITTEVSDGIQSNWIQHFEDAQFHRSLQLNKIEARYGHKTVPFSSLASFFGFVF